MNEATDEMIVAARAAIERRQRSLIGKITKSSIRDALVAAEEAKPRADLSGADSGVCPACAGDLHTLCQRVLNGDGIKCVCQERGHY